MCLLAGGQASQTTRCGATSRSCDFGTEFLKVLMRSLDRWWQEDWWAEHRSWLSTSVFNDHMEELTLETKLWSGSPWTRSVTPMTHRSSCSTTYLQESKHFAMHSEMLSAKATRTWSVAVWRASSSSAGENYLSKNMQLNGIFGMMKPKPDPIST